MGKIFDALEKSNRQSQIEALASPHSKVRGAKRSNRGNDNIVALDNSSRIGKSQHIDEKLVAYHAPMSVEAELFKVLRTNLLFPANGKLPRKILITSPLPGDGKSFVTSNLAISIAQGVEEYVLLIDCDVRRPQIHKHFGFGQVTGLSEHLSAGTELSKSLLKTPIPKLTVLPAGKPPANPTELLSSKRMKALLNDVANRYDDRFIIIDSPPPSMAAETSAIVSFVDGVILIVKAGSTPRSAVNETIEQIGKEKILGVVLNQSDQPLKKYYSYGKPYYSKEGA